MLTKAREHTLDLLTVICRDGIKYYQSVSWDDENFQKDRQLIGLGDAHSHAAQALVNYFHDFQDYFPWVVLRNLTLRYEMRKLHSWILKIIEENDGTIPETFITWDGKEYVLK